MSLTTKQARAIADALFEAALAIDTYLDKNFKKLTRDEYENLHRSFKILLRAASSATTKAVGLAIKESEVSTKQLKSVIAKAKKKIKVLKKVKQVIQLSAELADLAAAIMAKDPGAIVSSTNNIITTIAANSKDETAPNS